MTQEELNKIVEQHQHWIKEDCEGWEDVDAVIAGLKQKLDEQEAENRRLKRALWLARSYRGSDNSILLPSKFMRNVWDNVERKCLKKAEEYR